MIYWIKKQKKSIGGKQEAKSEIHDSPGQKYFLKKGANMKYDPMQRVKEERNRRKIEKELLKQQKGRTNSPMEVKVEYLDDQVGRNQLQNQSFEDANNEYVLKPVPHLVEMLSQSMEQNDPSSRNTKYATEV